MKVQCVECFSLAYRVVDGVVIYKVFAYIEVYYAITTKCCMKCVTVFSYSVVNYQWVGRIRWIRKLGGIVAEDVFVITVICLVDYKPECYIAVASRSCCVSKVMVPSVFSGIEFMSAPDPYWV